MQLAPPLYSALFQYQQNKGREDSVMNREAEELQTTINERYARYHRICRANSDTIPGSVVDGLKIPKWPAPGVDVCSCAQ